MNVKFLALLAKMSFENFKYMYQEIVKILFVESNVVESKILFKNYV